MKVTPVIITITRTATPTYTSAPDDKLVADGDGGVVADAMLVEAEWDVVVAVETGADEEDK